MRGDGNPEKKSVDFQETKRKAHQFKTTRAPLCLYPTGLPAKQKDHPPKVSGGYSPHAKRWMYNWLQIELYTTTTTITTTTLKSAWWLLVIRFEVVT